jgi:hypothetical protein
MRNGLLTAALYTCLSALALPAQASLIVRDYATPGDGLITYDPLTGLEWLDLSVSLNSPPGSVVANYSGFRLAYRSEVESLLIAAGIPQAHLNTGLTYLEDLPAGQLLANTIGVNFSAFNGAVKQIYGRVLRPTNDRYDLYFLEIRSSPATPQGTSNLFLINGNTLTSWGSNDADFLVRQAAPQVPEPATFGLVGLALLGGGWSLRRGSPRN